MNEIWKIFGAFVIVFLSMLVLLTEVIRRRRRSRR